MANNDEDLLRVNKKDQEKIVNELIEKSRPSSPYNLLLISSAVIIACGLLMDNIAIVIGGMLVTPLLTPILSLGLGVAIGEISLVKRSFRVTLRSFLIVVLIAIFLSFIFQITLSENEVLSQIVSAGTKIPIIYVIVALISGAIGTFAWAHPKIYEALPGVAISVSLLPPLSALGVGIGLFSATLLRISLLIFMLNLLGVFLGSLFSFSLMSFYKAKQEAHKQIVEEEKEQKENNNNKS